MRKKVTMGDLGTIVTGNTPPRSMPELYGNYTPFVKATDISETEKYTYTPEEYYSKEGHDKYIRSLVPKGSTCVVTIGSIGKKMTMAHCDLFINQAMNAIIPNEKYDNEFVYYAVKNVLPNIKGLDSGTASGRENVSKSAFSKMEVVVDDDLNTQHRIASILSRYDSLIENYQKQIKLLEEAAQRLYKEWFVDLHFPGHENTKIVDGVPEGWEKKKLIDLAEVQYGYAFDGKLFNNIGVGMPILRIRNIPDGITSDYTIEEVTENYIVHNGDIVVGMDGIFHINSWSGGDAYLVQRACSFRPKEEKIRGFIFQAIQEPIKFFEKTLVGATVAHLGKKHIDSIEMIVPSNEKLYVPFLKEFIQRQNLLTQIRLLTEARDRLLPKLMSGEFELK
ncbi:MAG: restriction endonuclease subunit S [Bacteroidaceae bacterium]|nr:restriction endonuclease subunit S [Bacteroidaceae bacterium]